MAPIRELMQVVDVVAEGLRVAPTFAERLLTAW
jgi:hypothetical protein